MIIYMPDEQCVEAIPFVRLLSMLVSSFPPVLSFPLVGTLCSGLRVQFYFDRLLKRTQEGDSCAPAGW